MELTAQQIERYRGISVPQLIKSAEKHFNAYIRQRDREGDYFTCISCYLPKRVDQMNAGHYLSAGHNAAVRFSEDNVNGQCIHCNLYLHGNQANYRIGLVRKIGQHRVEILESTARMRHKWDRYGLIYVIETYKQKTK